MATRSRTKSSSCRQTEYTLVYPGQEKPTRYGGSTIAFSETMIDEVKVPMYRDGKLQWKSCSHTKFNTPGRIVCNYLQNGKPFWNIAVNIAGSSTISPPPTELYAEAYEKLLEEIDLNCHERVMSYSYVADLLPFLGAFTRASSTLNKVGRWIARTRSSLRHRPFTEVMSLMMKGDLINRFVIQTTLKDTVDILNVYDRCLRAFQMANLRNEGDTILTASASSITTGSSSRNIVAWNYGIYNSVMPGTHVQRIFATSRQRTAYDLKLKAKLKLKYDTSTADPAKWVMHALGIDTPFESIWDKVPFSFVVDYFFRVGEFIERMGDAKAQYGLVGRICAVHGIWELLSVSNGREITDIDSEYESGWITSANYSIDRPVIGTSQYTRSIGSLPKAVGFWDTGGLWKPQLSSVRKRTLVELGYQLLSRGRS